MIARNEEQARLHHATLVEEAKVAFEAQDNREMAELAVKAGVESIDSNSYRFDGSKFIDFASALASESASKKA